MNFKTNFYDIHERDRLDLCTGYDTSPVVPVQTSYFVRDLQTSQDGSESDRSEILIPLVTSQSTKHMSNMKTTIHESQNTEMCEESQSLLPQLPQGTHQRFTFKPTTNECLSSSSCSQTVQDFPMLSLNPMKKDQELSMTKINADKRKSHQNDPSLARKQNSQSFQYSLRQNRKINTRYTDVPELSKKGKSFVRKQGGKVATKIETTEKGNDKHMNGRTPEDMETIWSQKQVLDTEMTEDDITFSQVPLSQTVVGENSRGSLSSSHGEINATQAENISSKIENLVASLNKVSRKQMLVTEATLLQCISHLQDSIHKHLKKKYSPCTDDSIGTYRQLLITSQTGLAKISEFHKKEKIALNQSENTQTVTRTRAGLSQSNNRPKNDQATKDLGKRQKRVLTLLKRQRCLVDLLKTIKRSSSFVGDFDKPGKFHSTHSVKALLKTDNTTVDESLYHSCKKSSCTESPQISGASLKKNSHNMDVEQVQNQPEKENKVVDAGNTTVTRPEDILHTATGFDVVDKCYTADDNLVNNDSQRYITQDSIRTSGIDLFDDGEDIESIADGNKENVRCMEGNNSQVSDSAKDKNIMKRVDDNLYTNIPFEFSQTSSYRSNQAASEGNQTIIQSSVKPVEIIHQGIMQRECIHHSKEVVSDTKMHEMQGATVFKTRSAEKFDVNVLLDESNDNDDIDRYETAEQSETTAQAANTKNVNANQLKRRLDVSAENDLVEEMKMKRTEIKNVGPGKLGNVPRSEGLWLNMLRSHSDRSKICSEQQHPSNDKQKDEVLLAKKLSNNPLGNGDLEQDLIDSDRNSGTQKLVSLFDKNSNKQSFGTVEFDILKRDRSRQNSRHNAEIAIPDDLEALEELVDDGDGDDDKDNQSPDVCSPSSMAVRGSPCETMNNMSPKCSTVCSEIFTLRPMQLGIQGEVNTDIVSGAQGFKINSKGYETENSMTHKQNNIKTTLQWIMPKQFDKVPSKPGIADVQIRCVNNIKANNVKMTKEEDFDKCNEKSMTITDNISAAIDSVIQKSRGTNVGKVQVGDENSSNKQKQSMLPSLKTLVHGGVLMPGKLVLSFTLKGVVHQASLTQLGKIRTTDGHTFNTVSSWLSTLSNGVVFKERKSYESVFYKGRSLLSHCKQIESSFNNQHTRVTEPCTRMTDCSTQVDTSVFNVPHCTMTADEKWLNDLLSTSVVRLLNERDLVPNHDLPDNFWTEDLSKVTLHSDIWKSVVAW